MTARDDLAVAALTRALVRTGMYVDAGIDTSAGLDKPQVYAAAILNDPDMAADGLHFVMVETLERQAAQTERYANGGNLRNPNPKACEHAEYGVRAVVQVIRAALTSEDEIAHGEAWTSERGGLGECAYCDDEWPCRTQRAIDRLRAQLDSIVDPSL